MKCQVCGSPLKHVQYGTRISVESHQVYIIPQTFGPAGTQPPPSREVTDLHVFLRFDCSKEDCGQKHLATLSGPLSLGLLIAD